MKKRISIVLLLVQIFTLSAQQISLKSEGLNFNLSPKGQITTLSNPVLGKNYLAMGEKSPLLQIRVGNDWYEPTGATLKSGIISLVYQPVNITAQVKVFQKKTHLTFELIKIDANDKVNAVIWGPYPTIINKTIGEVVGVVRDGEYAIGIQALNPKTVGGVLNNSEGSNESRGSTAIPQAYGSSLQAFSLDRSKDRKITVWGRPEMPVKAIPNETTLGSKIAIFGCAEPQVLSRIGAIELAEGLPHAMINGVWFKQSPETGRAYLISDFDEKTVDAMLDYTQQAGLVSLYHEGPFKSWGHFILNPVAFPNGNASMKACVDKATKKGIRIGVHTLSTFINTNDPYVTPIPDKRLSMTGSSVLTENISATANEIPVASDQYFKNIKSSTLHAVKIGDEIIRFREVSAEAPYKLLDCQRGMYGTKASDHPKDEMAGMLFDYPYNTLFPNFELQQEIAGNLGRFFNETGVSHMDFDGHEGCLSAGEGDYGMQIFADKVIKDTKQTLVNGTSRSYHYYWHLCHYWNWGEPWYGGFRESQGDYRLENQPFLERNYMPNMLGWFLLSSTTGAEDIEWMMARAAGYNAGFALVARYKSLQTNPNTAQLLALVKLWQEAYRSKIFSADQIARLKNPENDFHLEKANGTWKLFPFKKFKFEHEKKNLQPGEPTFSQWEFINKEAEQPLNFTLTFVGKEGSISNPWIEIDGYFKMELPGEYGAGNSVVCDGTTIKLYNKKGGFVKDIVLKQGIPSLKSGKHSIKFDCQFPEEKELTNRFIIKTISSPEIITK
ncbi:hypothetical protein [Flavobacterium gilvum]|uniref:Glycoside hydrolase n=1 Tax=Flavobacterium gilvum TaxID=1492737 RepID=A0AAC9I761_9FLAO|nr:hypothetical protein [Flavobacterium gilvum]AOW10551.1 hypothetical protein EM308_14170 [Flavobacterium gilvum]KFC59581.1 hypothetical protein FEM08_16300 [Flavobacterium gilvum]